MRRTLLYGALHTGPHTSPIPTGLSLDTNSESWFIFGVRRSSTKTKKMEEAASDVALIGAQ